MSTKIFLIAISFVLFAACNNSGKEAEVKKDSSNVMMNHDSVDHMNMSSTDIPPLPAVPDGAKVFFVSPKDGATVSSPFKVQMGVSNIKVDTAGPVLAGVGHHHLFIDAEDSLPAGTPVPKDDNHIHYGKGQTESADITLSPGKHKLTLQFADGLHRSYGSKLSSTITVNVK
jgi:hypothetical protein